jgi:hypothetical protein
MMLCYAMLSTAGAVVEHVNTTQPSRVIPKLCWRHHFAGTAANLQTLQDASLSSPPLAVTVVENT